LNVVDRGRHAAHTEGVTLSTVHPADRDRLCPGRLA